MKVQPLIHENFDKELLKNGVMLGNLKPGDVFAYNYNGKSVFGRNIDYKELPYD